MSYDNYHNGGPGLDGVNVDNNTQWRIKAENLLAACNVFTPHVSKKFPLGAIAEARDGRKWRYCKNSSAATLSKALMNVAQVHDAEAITSTAQTGYGAAAGAKSFDVLQTTGNAWSNNDLIDGFLLVGDGGTAMSDMYVIKGNKWKTSDTVMTVEIADTGGLRNAIAATDDVVLFRNKCRDTIVAPTTQTNGGAAIGVSLADVTASYYYWAQFRGYAPMVLDTTDTIVVGEPVGRAGTLDVAGCVGLVANDGTDQVWGVCVYASTNAECAIIDLMLP